MQELKDYIEVRRYLDKDTKNLVKITVDNDDIKHLIVDCKGDIVDSGEIITEEIEKEDKDGNIVIIERISNSKEQQTFFNSQIEIKFIEIGKPLLVRHRGKEDEITPYVETYPPTKIETYV